MPNRMRTALGLGLAVICALLLVNTSASAKVALPQDAGKKAKSEPDPKQSKKPTTYAVVQVDNEYRVVAADKINDLKKELDTNYKSALKRHEDAKKAAQKKKQKFTDPKPEKARLKIVNPKLPSEEAAQEFVAKLREKEKPKGERRGKGSDGEGDDGKGDDDKGKKKDKDGGGAR